jgi:aconitate hydratase A / 2-methylisocitrate dehydratase
MVNKASIILLLAVPLSPFPLLPLPLQFVDGQNAESLGLKGDEVYDITGMSDDMAPQSLMNVKATKPDGSTIEFKVKALLNTEVEVNYYRNGGILHTVLRNMVK